MNYYRRDIGDGTCEVICTRCFLTLGKGGPAMARELEALHLCPAFSPDAPTSDSLSTRERAEKKHASAWFAAGRCTQQAADQAAYIPFAYVTIVFFSYALPTAIEFIATRHLSPWIGTILLGDIVGCLCLAAIFKLRRTAVLLYLALTVLEALLFQFNVVSANALIWIVDLVPTLILLRLAARTRGHASTHTGFVR